MYSRSKILPSTSRDWPGMVATRNRPERLATTATPNPEKFWHHPRPRWCCSSWPGRSCWRSSSCGSECGWWWRCGKLPWGTPGGWVREELRWRRKFTIKKEYYIRLVSNYIRIFTISLPLHYIIYFTTWFYTAALHLAIWLFDNIRFINIWHFYLITVSNIPAIQ